MQPVGTVTLALAVFAFVAALFNLWLYAMRARERAYLWLGVASIGVTWLAVGFAATYDAQTLREAQNAQLVALGGGLPLAMGFIRFSDCFAGIRHRVLDACVLYTFAVTAIAYADPSLLFSGEATWIAPPLGRPYVQADISPSAGMFSLGFALAIVWIFVAYARRAPRLRGGHLVTGALGVWAVCMANDLLVALGFYWGPWLLPLGFAAFASAFGGVLLEDLVRSQRQLEENAGALHDLVEARTEELRRKDLEMAHGARLATLGALAGDIAHEIEEPLAAIEADLEEFRGAPGGSARERLAHAQRSIERIRHVVAELLQLARRGEGKRGTHELAEIAAGVLPIASHALRQRAQLETHLAKAPKVSGDAAMLSQIVLNLLVGAIQTVPARSGPKRATISLSTQEHEGGARLVVADNTPAAQGEITPDLFGLVETDGDDPRRLGLAVTKQLVERHGGTIAVESSEAGTRVTVDLPGASGGAPR
jgi:signal transduction histidine kinase